MKKPAPSEHELQVTLLEFLKLQKGLYCFAIPNAGKRGYWAAMRMKAEGLRAGVADLCVMVQGGGVVWLELKSSKGRLRDEQLWFAAICDALGHRHAVVHSFEEAVAALKKFGAIK